jgi:4-amino-4-deoxy-L-arabinose transferase-like glycosyltransferase
VVARARSAVDQATLDRLILVGLVVLAAVLRFADLSTRGTWDADQGNDMLVLRALVTNGELPLLGPPTSIGGFHHGVLYYYLLAPAAALSGADPLWVVGAIALAGVAAVAVTWWLARSIGGPVAGLVAGLLMAVSASAVDESTFIWNPNLIALSSSVALAGAWRAWSSGRARWWLVAAAGAIVTMHCHVLGSILLPAIAGLLVADIRRQGRGPARSARLGTAIAAAAMLAASYVPLAIHELTTEFSETRAALDFIGGGGEPSALALPLRLVVVTLRVLAWPLSGLITDAPVAALLCSALVVAFVVWRSGAASGPERTAARWFGLTLAWSVLALTVAASGLTTVVRGLPNDHYHAFADPIVFVIVGLGAAALCRWRPAAVAAPVGAIAAAGVVAALVVFNLATLPPAVNPDGGWPAARAAADRVLADTGMSDPIVLESLPVFKPPNALRFPLVASGAEVRVAGTDGTGPDGPRVVLCDDLFGTAIGAPCGGPAEDAAVTGLPLGVVDRFEAAPGRWFTVYLPR